MYTTDIEDMSIYFIRSLLTQQKSVQQIAKNIERDFGLLKGCGLSLFKHLVILKTIEIDMKCKYQIENTSPYRGDLKEMIERQFRTINGKIKRKSPGAIQKEYRERGERDFRLDASR